MKKLVLILLSTLALCSQSYAQLGSLDKDLVFTPVDPCRIVDTRNPGGNTGVIPAGVARSFLALTTANYFVQGGSATNCNLTAGTNTAAIVLNFTVVNPSTSGFITAFPANTTAPLAATLNFNAGDIKGNNATLKLGQEGGYQLKVFTTSQTHLVADVVGYYAKPIATALDCYQTPQVLSPINIPIPSASRYVGFVTAPACSTGYTASGTSCASTSAIANLSAVVNSVCYANHSNDLESVAALQRCCRTPGR